MVDFYDELDVLDRLILDNIGRFVSALLAFSFLRLLGVF